MIILFKREIIKNILLGRADNSNSFVVANDEPKFSKEFIKALVTIWHPDLAWEYVEIFVLVVNYKMLGFGIKIEGGNTKEVYMDFNLKIVKEN